MYLKCLVHHPGPAMVGLHAPSSRGGGTPGQQGRLLAGGGGGPGPWGRLQGGARAAAATWPLRNCRTGYFFFFFNYFIYLFDSERS